MSSLEARGGLRSSPHAAPKLRTSRFPPAGGFEEEPRPVRFPLPAVVVTRVALGRWHSLGGSRQ